MENILQVKEKEKNLKIFVPFMHQKTQEGEGRRIDMKYKINLLVECS